MSIEKHITLEIDSDLTQPPADQARPRASVEITDEQVILTLPGTYETLVAIDKADWIEIAWEIAHQIKTAQLARATS